MPHKCQFYPGDGYADYFAISYWDGSPGLGACSPAGHDVYLAETRRLFNEALDLGLPLAIAESTPAYIGTFSGQKSTQWLETYFDLIEELDLRFVAYTAPTSLFGSPFVEQCHSRPARPRQMTQALSFGVL